MWALWAFLAACLVCYLSILYFCLLIGQIKMLACLVPKCLDTSGPVPSEFFASKLTHKNYFSLRVFLTTYDKVYMPRPGQARPVLGMTQLIVTY